MFEQWNIVSEIAILKKLDAAMLVVCVSQSNAKATE